MHPPCPHCDPPEASLLRLVLMSEVLRTDETMLLLLVEVLQQSGLLSRSENPTAPPVRRQKGTLHTFRRSDAKRP